MNTRTVASGLLIAVFFIVKFQSFFEKWVRETTLYPELTVPLKNLLINTASGKDIYFHAVFILGCLGISLFTASIIYPLLERFFFGSLSFGHARYTSIM